MTSLDAEVVSRPPGRVGLLGLRGADTAREVVVHAEEVQRRPDDLEVTVLEEAEVGHRLPHRAGRLRVATGEDRLGEQEVRQQQRPVRSGPVGLAVGDRRHRLQVERDAQLVAWGQCRPQPLDRQPVPQQQVVGGGQGSVPLLGARGVPAAGVAQDGGAERLVEGDPAVHPVAEVLLGDLRVLGEALGGVADPPATRVLQRLGQVPVVEGDRGRDPLLQQRVHQPVVERRGPPGSPAPCPSAGCAATPARSGSCRHPARPSARRPRHSGGSGRRPRHRCHRWPPSPGCG